MKKKSFMWVIAMLLSTLVIGQANRESTEEKVGKYLVKLITNDDNTFGYEIYLENKLVERQTSNPLFSLSPGFYQKKSAIVFGKWYANELLEGRNNKYVLTLPKARELGVSDDDLQFKTPNKH